MIEKLAIFALVLLNQLNPSFLDQNKFDFLNKFVKKETVLGVSESLGDNQLYYKKNLPLEASLRPLPYKIDNASSFSIEAKSAIVLDAGTNAVLYSLNSDEKLPIASLTKIMTAIVILDNAKSDDIVTIGDNAVKAEGRKNGLVAGEKISVENLLKILLVESNNTAATALAEYVGGNVEDFVKLMNEKVKLLGLKNTKFFNPTGLDEDGVNESTAYEFAQLVSYSLRKPAIWEALKSQNSVISSSDGKMEHRLKNTNLLLGKLDNVAGGKTGFTDKAGQCLALVIGDPKDNHQIISVVLNASDRFMETEKLVKWVFESYRW